MIVEWCRFYDSISKVVFLRQARKTRDEFVAELCDVGGRLLDIGMAEHTAKYVESADWFHRRLRATEPRNEVWGADINASLVDYVRAHTGWERIICADATAEPFIPGYFDAIHAGDIIEHVSNLSGFMQFCRGALKPGGKLVITTPNPHASRIVRSAFRYGNVIANMEHTCWLSPSTMNELARREGFILSESWYLWKWKRTFITRFPKKFFKLRDLHFPEYLFILNSAVS